MQQLNIIPERRKTFVGKSEEFTFDQFWFDHAPNRIRNQLGIPPPSSSSSSSLQSKINLRFQEGLPMKLRNLAISASPRNRWRANLKWWLLAAICFALFQSSTAQSETVPEPEYMKFVVNATEFPPEDYYDYVIVGGGTSGCPLAATLSENFKVLLIERGGVPYGKPELLSQEGFLPTLMQFNRFDSPADVFTSEEGVPNARGRILGGSSAINAGFYSRADAEFYGKSGMNWDPGLVNQSYEWVEREVVFRPELRNWQSAVRDGLVEAGVGPYHDFTLDHIVGTKISGSTFDSTGRRHSSADLLIHGIPANLKIALHATVERILLARSPSSDNSNLSAIGVVYRDDLNHYHHAMVRDGGEIIISAGALGSPQLLLLSGIGSRPYLSSWGIPVARHSPYVGQFLYDNPRNGISILPSVSLEHSLIQVVGITGSGTFLEAASNVIPFTSTAHSLFTRVPPSPLYLTVATIMEKVAGPISSGSLRLASTDVKFNPVVRFNYFSDPTDLKRCVSGLRKIGDVLNTRAMQDFKVRQWPLAPDFRYIGPRLPSNQSDDKAMSEFCRSTVSTLWHYHGGCIVGKVVNPDLHVIGVSSLRVVDGSVLSISPGTNPQATLMMLGSSVKLGTIGDVYVANNIITHYSKCGKLHVARNLFDAMPQRDTISWNSMIAGYVNCRSFWNAWELLCDMTKCGFVADGFTFGSILKGVAHLGELSFGKQVHLMAVKTGFQTNVYVGSALVDMYSKCGRIDHAHTVLTRMPECNSVCWNALIAGYVEEGNQETVLELFNSMQKEGVKIDDGTVSPLLTLLDDPEFYSFTSQIHSKVVKCGLALNNNVSNAIITSYSECGSLQDAEKVFCSSYGIHDIVTWNSMLAAYLAHNEQGLAFRLFVRLLKTEFEPDVYSYTSLISSCFEKMLEQQGKVIHSLIIKKGMEISAAISNSLISMYLKSNGKWMDDAKTLFDTMEFKDPVSWNSILMGYSQFGSSEDTMKLFKLMLMSDVMIDHYSFSAILKSCSDLATLQLGQQVHVVAIKSGWKESDHVSSSLITMYSKCGLIEDSFKSFEDSSKNTSITWNFIIFAFAQHGQGGIALELFKNMSKHKVKYDHVTFVAVLTACSHTGLLEEGRYFLTRMEQEYKVSLRMEHYACGVDLFGRAGLLGEAKKLIESMPFDPDAMLWKTLLGACRSCGDVELANQIATHLLELEPEDHCSYVLLSDIYGRSKRWGQKAGLTKLMRERGVKKVPGWSWIEVEKKMNVFSAEDCSHPNSDQIYCVLELLIDEMQMMNHSLDLEVPVGDLDHLNA